MATGAFHCRLGCWKFTSKADVATSESKRSCDLYIRFGRRHQIAQMVQLAAYPRQNGVATALREFGRMERTLFTLDWLEDPQLQRQTIQELDKGEAIY